MSDTSVAHRGRPKAWSDTCSIGSMSGATMTWTVGVIEEYVQNAERELDKRDGRVCLITKSWKHQPAHIIPPAIFNSHHKEQDYPPRGVSGNILWSLLRTYMMRNECSKYLDEFQRLTSGQLKPCENYLTLNSDASDAWNDGIFGLKPVALSDDKMSMTLQIVFSGQDRIDIDSTLNAIHDFKNTANISKITRQGSDGVYALWNNSTMTPYKNGDTFEVVTDDPVNRPLPSRTLLELKFWWSRLLGTLTTGSEVDGLPNTAHNAGHDRNDEARDHKAFDQWISDDSSESDASLIGPRDANGEIYAFWKGDIASSDSEDSDDSR
jgi:hypothetical protein